MISQIYRSLLTVGLISFLSFTLVFGITIDNSWASDSLNHLGGLSQTQISSRIALMDGMKAITKDIEGKAQEALGNVTGDRKNQMAGKAKQVEAKVRNAVEDTKTKTKELVNKVDNKAKDINNAVH
jgi:uncharacterized protein YjbJ (UPF0337 family)